jgi:hypothetical protein
VTQQRQWISIRKLIRHLRPAPRWDRDSHHDCRWCQPNKNNKKKFTRVVVVVDGAIVIVV